MTNASLPLVALVAVLAPLLVELPLLRLLPVVVVELGLGIVAGPVLDLTEPSELVKGLSGLGMAFLFFAGGLEIDLRRIAGRPLVLGVSGWVLSLAIAFGLAGVLVLVGLDVPVLFVGAALATTALGTLMPILRDAGVLPTALGRNAVAAGMCGELFPIVAISLVLTGTADEALTGVLLVAFALVILVCAFAAAFVRPARIRALMDRTMHATSQLPVRACILLLVVLVYLASDLGLDVVLGAFAAGMVVRLAIGSRETTGMLEHKLDAIAFGFLVPVFFITTGLTFDLDGLLGDSEALVLMPVFLLALLVVRGIPALMYRELRGREQVALAFYSSTTLPLVVAITTIAVDGDHMRTPTAAALVAAAILSVVLFPLIALLVRGRTSTPIAPLPEAPVPLGA
jgi:Kef-type K+ transport system membrane component KefB